MFKNDRFTKTRFATNDGNQVEMKRSFLAGDAGMDHEQNFCPGGTFWGKGR